MQSKDECVRHPEQKFSGFIGLKRDCLPEELFQGVDEVLNILSITPIQKSSRLVLKSPQNQEHCNHRVVWYML